MKRNIVFLISIALACFILAPQTQAVKEVATNDRFLLWEEHESHPQIYDIAVGSTYIWGAHPEGAIRWHKQNRTFQRFSQADGLIDSFVTAVEIDHAGNVWFGTPSGLSRFDGTNWSHFTENNVLNDNNILALSIGLNGELIVGAGGGVTVHDGSNWHTYEHNSNVDPSQCLKYGTIDVAIDQNGYLWKASESGPVCYYNGSMWRVLFHEGESVNADRFEIGDNGDMWFAGISHQNKHGVMLLETDGTWHHILEADGLLDDEATSVTIDKNGGVWIGIDGSSTAEKGVSFFDGNSWTSYSRAEGYYGNAVHDIVADVNGDIWTGSSSNVSRFKSDKWQAYLAGPPGGFIYDITFDQNDHLWASFYRNGVVKFDGEKWIQYTEADGLASDHAYAILADPNGNMWLACNAWGWSTGGITKFDGTSWITFTTDDGLASNFMNDLTMDDNGTLWIAYRYDGVGTKTSTGWENYTAADGLLSDGVGSIYSQGNDLWIGYQGGYSFGSGVSNFNGLNWLSYENELLYDTVVGFATKMDGGLVALARNGINEFDGVSWSGYAIPDVMDFYPISDEFQAYGFAIDDNDWVWISGIAGLFVFDGNDWYFYREENIPVSKISSGQPIASNNARNEIWVGSQKGIVQVTSIELIGQIFLPMVQK